MKRIPTCAMDDAITTRKADNYHSADELPVSSVKKKHKQSRCLGASCEKRKPDGTRRRRKHRKSSRNSSPSCRSSCSEATDAHLSSAHRRPEPEGASRPSRPVTELDILMCYNAPLFSDNESGSDGESSAVNIQQPARRRFQKTDIDFRDMDIPVGLPILSNSSIKYAIIGTELTNIINVSLRRVTTSMLPNIFE